jgi:hypothetical protein
MNARINNSADKMENNKRIGHAGARAAPKSDASNIKKVEPTTHQLVFTDSTPNGRVALKRSLSVSASGLVSRDSSPTCLASHIASYSWALCMGRFVNVFHIAPIESLRTPRKLPRRILYQGNVNAKTP